MDQTAILFPLSKLLPRTSQTKDDKMKDNFEKCFDMLLKHEGGFMNNPEDPGGATNLCVTERVVQEFTNQTDFYSFIS